MLAGSPQVTVTRVYDLLPVEELRLAFSAHVAERTGWPLDSFTAKAPRNLQSIPVPVGSRAIKVDTDPGENFRGSVLARLLLEIDGEPYRELGHRFEVERYVEALVAARKIPRGRRLSASDVEVAKIEQSLAGEDSLSSVEEAVGLLAARTIQAGKALRAESLTLPPVVRRGERMTVVLAGNGFQILTMGRALEDGATDEIVRVRLQSRKIVKAVVVDSKMLHMIAQGE
jgi:flagella basal body P-ring formation protein FlgA